MNATIAELHALIKNEQDKTDNKMAVQIGDHLKDIIGSDEGMARIAIEDFKAKNKVLEEIDKKLFEEGKKRRKSGNGYAFTMKEAEFIIREFFGLPEPGEAPQAEIPDTAEGKILSITDFL